MEIFIDSGDLGEIREVAKWGIIKGVTTNPTLIAKEQCLSLEEITKEIAKIIPYHISAEVIAQDKAGIIKEARMISSWAEGVVVKIPLTEEGVSAAAELEKEGIKTNLTLIFSLSQALVAANAGASYMSLFVGRLDDIGIPSYSVLKSITDMLKEYKFKTRLIVASVRHVRHIIEGLSCGANIATVPFAVLKQLFVHPLTTAGLERFLRDWRSANITLER
jgi:transaldolase